MTYSHLADIQLLLLLQEGDEAAFAEIYARYRKLLYRTAFRMTEGDDTAKEAVQVVFIALWQRRADANVQSLKAYLQQAVRYQVLKGVRDQKKDKDFYAQLAAITPDRLYENHILFKEQMAFFRKTLNTLFEDCRLIFSMNREEQMTYKQIAAQLNISEKTVEKKMSFSLKQIRQAFKQYHAFVVVAFSLLSF